MDTNGITTVNILSKKGSLCPYAVSLSCSVPSVAEASGWQSPFEAFGQPKRKTQEPFLCMINKFFNWKVSHFYPCVLWFPLLTITACVLPRILTNVNADGLTHGFESQKEMSENLAVWCGRAVAPLTEPNGSSHMQHGQQPYATCRTGCIAADLCNLSRNIKLSHCDVGPLPTFVASLFCPLKKTFLRRARPLIHATDHGQSEIPWETKYRRLAYTPSKKLHYTILLYASNSSI